MHILSTALSVCTSHVARPIPLQASGKEEPSTKVTFFSTSLQTR